VTNTLTFSTSTDIVFPFIIEIELLDGVVEAKLLISIKEIAGNRLPAV